MEEFWIGKDLEPQDMVQEGIPGTRVDGDDLAS